MWSFSLVILFLDLLNFECKLSRVMPSNMLDEKLNHLKAADIYTFSFTSSSKYIHI